MRGLVRRRAGKASVEMAEWTHITHGQRYRQVAAILARHGLGYVVGMVGWDAVVPFHRGLLGHPRRDLPYTRPEHVRMAFEELGVVAIKLGQMLSTRTELLPPAFQHELAKLQDAAPPVPVAAIRSAIEAALHQPVTALFASFEDEPLAAASIAQVHAAILEDGAEVVVKVRRPGAAQQIETDLAILEQLAARAERHFAVAARAGVVDLIAEFARTLRAELDFQREGQNAEHFARNFAPRSNVCIPRIIWDRSAADILTMTRLHGIKISDIQAINTVGIDRHRLAQRAATIVLQMVFEDGFYHADPHPGNFVITPDGAIGLMDFGMVGTVSSRTQRQLTAVLMALGLRDSEALADAVLDLGVTAEHVSRDRFGVDIEHVVAETYDVPLRDIALAPLLRETLALLRGYQLRLPAHLSLLVKTIIMNEGLGTLLDPEFRLTSVLTLYAERLIRRQYLPDQLARRLAASTPDLIWLATESPRRLRRLLSDVERGAFQVGIAPTAERALLRHIDQSANRIALSLLAAAFIVGLAVLMAVYHPGGGGNGWLPIFFYLGVAAASILGVATGWLLLRSRRDRFG